MAEEDKDTGPQAEPAPAEGTSTEPSPEEAPGEGGLPDPYGPPFSAKTFGGAFVWAKGSAYTCTVLRVREGENVAVSTQGRTDMVAMLTGGRGVLEIREGQDVERVELVPATPTPIDPGRTYRLIALTEVELFTVYSPLPA